MQLARLGEVLTRGRDYLFFDTVDCTHQSMITTVTRGAAVITPNVIAVIPDTEESDALAVVKVLLADEDVDLTKLETTLRAIFAGAYPRWVFPIAELEMFRVTAGVFGTIALRMRRESVRRLIIRDKGGKAAAKAFLSTSPRWSPPQRSTDPSPSPHCA